MDEQSQDNISYNPEDDDDFATPEEKSAQKEKPADKDRVVSWTGSEFIANHKNSNWFLGFFGILALIIIVIFLVTRDVVSTVSITVVGTLFALLANRKPREISYKIDNKGINMGSKFYPFEQFKSFSLAQDGAIGYVNLMPLKRFMPDVSIYFPPEEADNIIAILSDHLSHDESEERQIDKLAKRFRF